MRDTTWLGCDTHGIHNRIMRDAFGSSIYATDLLTGFKTIVRTLVWKDMDQFNSKEVIETISSIENEFQVDDQYPHMARQGPEVYNVKAGSAYIMELGPSNDKKCT